MAVARRNNGAEFTSRVVAHRAGEPNQRAYLGSFNGRLQDEYLNDSWFVRLDHVRAVIEEWRQEYNVERPEKSFGGLAPFQNAKHLTAGPPAMPAYFKPPCY